MPALLPCTGLYAEYRHDEIEQGNGILLHLIIRHHYTQQLLLPITHAEEFQFTLGFELFITPAADSAASAPGTAADMHPSVGLCVRGWVHMSEWPGPERLMPIRGAPKYLNTRELENSMLTVYFHKIK